MIKPSRNIENYIIFHITLAFTSHLAPRVFLISLHLLSLPIRFYVPRRDKIIFHIPVRANRASRVRTKIRLFVPITEPLTPTLIGWFIPLAIFHTRSVNHLCSLIAEMIVSLIAIQHRCHRFVGIRACRRLASAILIWLRAYACVTLDLERHIRVPIRHSYASAVCRMKGITGRARRALDIAVHRAVGPCRFSSRSAGARVRDRALLSSRIRLVAGARAVAVAVVSRALLLAVGSCTRR